MVPLAVALLKLLRLLDEPSRTVLVGNM